MPSEPSAVPPDPSGALHGRPARSAVPGLGLIVVATLVLLAGLWTDAQAAKSKKHHEADSEAESKAGSETESEAESEAAEPATGQYRPRPDLPPVTAELSWVYVTSDWVGAESPPRPDGIADGHFQLRVETTDGLLIGLALCASNPRGTCGSQSWSLAPNEDERPLALVRDGRLVDEATGATLARIDGEAVFDLFAADVGWFRDGNWMLARGLLEDGRLFEALLQIP